MTIRRIGLFVLNLIAGLLSFGVMGYGLASAVFIDTRFNPVLSILYCVMPILSFPLFLLARLFRKLVALQIVLAMVYVGVYSALNWRTCASLGYCTGVLATVILTMKTLSVLAYFGSIILSIFAGVIENNP
jgi:hypothetical protein